MPSKKCPITKTQTALLYKTKKKKDKKKGPQPRQITGLLEGSNREVGPTTGGATTDSADSENEAKQAGRLGKSSKKKKKSK